MAIDANAMRTVYHIKNGAAQMYKIDAAHALKFTKEWSATPWEAGTGEADPVVEIPVDWKNGKPAERIALAVKLGADRKGLSEDKADELIDAEVKTRAAAAAAAAPVADQPK